MASLNGILSPPSSSDLANTALTLSAKRKREDSSDSQNINGESTASIVAEDTARTITDLIDVLRRSVSVYFKALDRMKSSHLKTLNFF